MCIFRCFLLRPTIISAQSHQSPLQQHCTLARLNSIFRLQKTPDSNVGLVTSRFFSFREHLTWMREIMVQITSAWFVKATWAEVHLLPGEGPNHWSAVAGHCKSSTQSTPGLAALSNRTGKGGSCKAASECRACSVTQAAVCPSSFAGW